MGSIPPITHVYTHIHLCLHVQIFMYTQVKGSTRILHLHTKPNEYVSIVGQLKGICFNKVVFCIVDDLTYVMRACVRAHVLVSAEMSNMIS